MKRKVDIISDDGNFIRLCRKQLQSLQCPCRYFSSDVHLEELMTDRHPGDVVVIHKQIEANTAGNIMDMLRDTSPDTRVVLVSDHDDFYNDFQSWLADECKVIRPDLSRLSASLRRLTEVDFSEDRPLL